PIPGGSIFTTSAPQSASTPPAAGPATQTPISTTLTPAIGPGIGYLPWWANEDVCPPYSDSKSRRLRLTLPPGHRNLSLFPGRPAPTTPARRDAPHARKRRHPPQRRRRPALAREP